MKKPKRKKIVVWVIGCGSDELHPGFHLTRELAVENAKTCKNPRIVKMVEARMAGSVKT